MWEVLKIEVVKFTKENFEAEVRQSQTPVLLDFFASWCGPCKMLAPVIDEVAAEVTGAKVGKIDIDEQPELAREFGVMSVPTLVVMKNGRVTAKAVGGKSKRAIIDMIEQ